MGGGGSARGRLVCCLMPFCWLSLPRVQKAGLNAGYESVNECMKSICRMCEEENETQHLPSHVVQVRHDFINDLADLSCAFHRIDPQMYQPYDEDWVKEKTQQSGKYFIWKPGSEGQLGAGVYSKLW